MRPALIGIIRTALGCGTADGFFVERRLRLCAVGAVLGYAVILTLFQAHRLQVPGGACIDFDWIWLSSKFALSGALVEAYNNSGFWTVWLPQCHMEHVVYPPTLFVFTGSLGALPYWLAYTTWVAATLAVFAAAVYAILPSWVAVAAAASAFPAFYNASLGHNGFLTAGLFGLALAFMERRPWLSGFFLGLLTFKPQLGILFPIALLASRNWRVLLSAIVTGSAFAVAAAAAFGWQSWIAFTGTLAQRASSMSDHAWANVSMVSIFGFLRVVGVGASAAWAIQLVIAIMIGAVVFVLWARPISYSLKAAALGFGTLLASPHIQGYDICLVSVAVAFLVKDGLDRGFLRGERGIMLACWFALFLLAGPIPALVCAVLLALVFRRVLLPRQPNAGAIEPLETIRRRQIAG
ncbi:MAG TPA: glycosyltransferase family 87 protein [Pirellulales bacterium]|nr:glycosyltransferase family 87 protein [Pirellulales bacterium]